MAQFGLTKDDMDQVKDYVTAQDHLQYSQMAEDQVKILVTHCNIAANHVDLRFNLHSTVRLFPSSNDALFSSFYY
jgi:hypothetical protein